MGREERDEVTLVLLKAGMHTCFFALVMVRELGKTKAKRKKSTEKAFSHVQ